MMLMVLPLLGTGALVWAQQQVPPAPSPEQQPQVQEGSQQVWSPDQLNNLVAPIALYPDPLLGQMLVASTYPLEIVEANQWLQRNRNLRGQTLVDAARKQPWDPSVQALVAVPDALTKLNQDIRWTTDLGNAFLAQQADVMNAVQQMRTRAQIDGKLSSTPQQTVTTQAQGGQQVIVIQPADPQVIYVPSYDPVYVWGPPVYGYYPPLHYSGFGFSFGFGFNLGFCFSDWGGWGGWGWGPSWFGHSVYVNNYFFGSYGYHHNYHGGFGGRAVWSHDSGHRLGIPYRNHQVAARFGGASSAYRNSFRAGAGSQAGSAPYANRPAGRFGERTGEYGNRNMVPQGQRFQNPPRQRYQATQQNQPTSQQYRSAQQQYRSAPQEYRPAPQQYRSAPQEYRPAPQQYRSAPQQYRSVQEQFRPAPQTSAPQQYRSAPQQYRSAPQQFRSVPQTAAPRFSGGGNSGRSSSGGSNLSSGRGSSGGGGQHRR
jgi:hypothetical protein